MLLKAAFFISYQFGCVFFWKRKKGAHCIYALLRVFFPPFLRAKRIQRKKNLWLKGKKSGEKMRTALQVFEVIFWKIDSDFFSKKFFSFFFYDIILFIIRFFPLFFFSAKWLVLHFSTLLRAKYFALWHKAKKASAKRFVRRSAEEKKVHCTTFALRIDVVRYAGQTKSFLCAFFSSALWVEKKRAYT